MVHQKSRCFQSDEGGHMVSRICSFIWSSTHLLTRCSSCCPTIPSSACPCLLLSGISESCWCRLGSEASWVDHHHGEASKETQSMAWRHKAQKGEIFTDDYCHFSTSLCWVTNMQPSILLQDSDSLMSTLIAVLRLQVRRRKEILDCLTISNLDIIPNISVIVSWNIS